MRSKIKTAIIFCGGKGKRLHPITKKIPKPLVEIKSKPFIYYIIEQLISFKIKKIIFLTGYKSEILKKKILLFKNLKKKIKYSFVKTPVNWETSKRLNNLNHISDDYFMLLYSDNLVYFNFRDYMKKIDSRKIINLIIQNKKLAKENGNIQITDNKINYFPVRKKKCNYVELGYGVISKKIFKFLDDKNISFSYIIENMSKKNELNIFKVKNKYHSITNIEAVKTSSKTLLKYRKKILNNLI